MSRPRSSTHWPSWPGRLGSSRSPVVRSCAPVTTPTRWCLSMQVEIRLPELGAAPAVLSVWFAEEGERVYEGDRVIEVLVDGATFDVPGPATGRLLEKRALPDEELRIGQVLGIIESDPAGNEAGD